MTVAEAQAEARRLINQERNTGPAWAPIIQALGYDPRVGSGTNTTLQWQTPQNTAPPPKGEPTPDPKGQTSPLETIPRDPINGPVAPTPPTGAGPLGTTPKSEPTPNDPGGTDPGEVPGAPAGPPPPPPMPGRVHDSQYTADLAALLHSFQTGAAGLGLNYGLQVQYDANGRPTSFGPGSDFGRVGYDLGYGMGGQVDTRNPYSQAMLLQRHAEQAQRGISTGMATRGQLYSGARQRQLDESQLDYQRRNTGLQTSATRSFEDALLEAQGLLGGYNTGVTQAEASQADRWKQAENEWFRLYGTP